MRYMKKPVIVDAEHYAEATFEEVRKIMLWCPRAIVRDDEIYILTLEGEMHVSVGDYVIRGVKGEYYPCKPDIFEETYRPV